MDDTQAKQRGSQVGEAMQRALGAKGLKLSLAEARQLALALLSLAEHDLLVPAEPRLSRSTKS